MSPVSVLKWNVQWVYPGWSDLSHGPEGCSAAARCPATSVGVKSLQTERLAGAVAMELCGAWQHLLSTGTIYCHSCFTSRPVFFLWLSLGLAGVFSRFHEAAVQQPELLSVFHEMLARGGRFACVTKKLRHNQVSSENFAHKNRMLLLLRYTLAWYWQLKVWVRFQLAFRAHLHCSNSKKAIRGFFLSLISATT